MNNKSIVHILCGALVFSAIPYMNAMQAPRPNRFPHNISYKQVIFGSLGLFGTIFACKTLYNRYMARKREEAIFRKSLVKVEQLVQNQHQINQTIINRLDEARREATRDR